MFITIVTYPTRLKSAAGPLAEGELGLRKRDGRSLACKCKPLSTTSQPLHPAERVILVSFAHVRVSRVLRRRWAVRSFVGRGRVLPDIGRATTQGHCRRRRRTRPQRSDRARPSRSRSGRQELDWKLDRAVRSSPLRATHRHTGAKRRSPSCSTAARGQGFLAADSFGGRPTDFARRCRRIRKRAQATPDSTRTLSKEPIANVAISARASCASLLPLPACPCAFLSGIALSLPPVAGIVRACPAHRAWRVMLAVTYFSAGQGRVTLWLTSSVATLWPVPAGQPTCRRKRHRTGLGASIGRNRRVRHAGRCKRGKPDPVGCGGRLADPSSSPFSAVRRSSRALTASFMRWSDVASVDWPIKAINVSGGMTTLVLPFIRFSFARLDDSRLRRQGVRSEPRTLR